MCPPQVATICLAALALPPGLLVLSGLLVRAPWSTARVDVWSTAQAGWVLWTQGAGVLGGTLVLVATVRRGLRAAAAFLGLAAALEVGHYLVECAVSGSVVADTAAGWRRPWG